VARIRSIKPEFWSDEKLSECSLSARLLFIGLWTFADDEGRMEYAPARIRMQIFPCGSVTLLKVREFIRELTEHSLIRVYVVDGKEYLSIPNFTKHQKINRPTPSKLPPPSGAITEDSVNPPGALSESSPLERRGKELERERGSLRSRRAPSEFKPDFEYARSQIPDLDVDREAQKFRDWEFKTPRSDWPAVWRNWIERCRESGKYARIAPQGAGTEMLFAGKPVKWQ
jgi:hypothetical protein